MPLLNGTSMMDKEAPFKVIIVGAGVTGLTLAHCLAKAGIDYVLLDKGVVGPDFGTTITIQPHGCRILHQLGCLDEVLEGTAHMGGFKLYTPKGEKFANNDFTPVLKKQTGYDMRTLDRQEFLQKLYDLLPDKTKVHEHARVEAIEDNGSSVRVSLSDGREFSGDLVVGCDGVHSKMREILWDKANSTIPGPISVSEKRAMVTTYNAIVAYSKPVKGLPRNDVVITSHDKFSFLLICQPEWISYIVHAKLPDDQQCTWPTKRRFSDADMEALARRIENCPVNDLVTFGELWANRTKAQMISLEEGVLDHWHFGRIALAGDAIHKITPNSALGGNLAMEDAVALSNSLHAALKTHPNMKPTKAEIHDALQDYRDGRIDRVRDICQVGADLTRMHAYDGWKFWFLWRVLTPILGLDAQAKQIADICLGAPKLSYVDFAERRGLVAWKDSVAALSTAAAEKGLVGAIPQAWGKDLEAIIAKVAIILLVFTSITWVFLIATSPGQVPGFSIITNETQLILSGSLDSLV